MDTHAKIKELLNYLSIEMLITLHNQHCQDMGSEDEIYDNDDDFFTMFFTDVLEAVRAVCYGEYTYSDRYVKFNGYANLETTNNAGDWIDLDELTNAIIDGALMDLLKSYESETYGEINEVLAPKYYIIDNSSNDAAIRYVANEEGETTADPQNCMVFDSEEEAEEMIEEKEWEEWAGVMEL